MIAVGHLIGYGAGTINLPNIFGTLLGDSQFKQLTVIAAASLAFAVGVTSWAVEERVLVSAARYEALFKQLRCRSLTVAEMRTSLEP